MEFSLPEQTFASERFEDNIKYYLYMVVELELLNCPKKGEIMIAPQSFTIWSNIRKLAASLHVYDSYFVYSVVG